MNAAVPPRAYSMRQAQGALTGGFQDASSGLERRQAPDGSIWAWNTAYAPHQWMLVWEIQAGDTIWNLLSEWYGQRSLDLVHLVRDVPQNLDILGGNAAQAYPGDIILIPQLPDPWNGAPPAIPAPPGPTEPSSPPITTVTGQTTVTTGGAPTGGTSTPTNGSTSTPTNGGTSTPTNGNGAMTTTNGGEAPAPFWTTKKKWALGIAGGVAVIGIGAYLVTRD